MFSKVGVGPIKSLFYANELTKHGWALAVGIVPALQVRNNVFSLRS
jgi:hypothetical protein